MARTSNVSRVIHSSGNLRTTRSAPPPSVRRPLPWRASLPVTPLLLHRRSLPSSRYGSSSRGRSRRYRLVRLHEGCELLVEVVLVGGSLLGRSAALVTGTCSDTSSGTRATGSRRRRGGPTSRRDSSTCARSSRSTGQRKDRLEGRRWLTRAQVAEWWTYAFDSPATPPRRPRSEAPAPVVGTPVVRGTKMVAYVILIGSPDEDRATAEDVSFAAILSRTEGW